MASNNKQYVQFSKRMVMAVVFSEIALCAAAILLTMLRYDAAIVVEIIKANSPFAMVVFTAYSGNSAVEKWLIYTAKSKTTLTESETEDESASNG